MCTQGTELLPISNLKHPSKNWISLHPHLFCLLHTFSHLELYSCLVIQAHACTHACMYAQIHVFETGSYYVVLACVELRRKD